MNHSATQKKHNNQELQDLLTTISHDLAAPVRHVRAFSELLLNSVVNATPEQIEYKHYVENALTVLESKLDAITALSRASISDEQPAAIELTPIVELVGAQVLAHRDKNTATLEISGSLPAVRCRQTQLRELLRAVITNAVVHQPHDKTVCINVSANSTPEGVAINIGDNGPGIDSKYHEVVFDLFRQLAPDQNPGGIGAGLTLARKLAQENGGDVIVDSAHMTDAGSGTTISIVLPAA